MKRILLTGLFTALFTLTSAAQSAQYTDGVFILNEGGIGSNNSTISFLPNEGELQDDVYATVNDAVLGDTAQDMLFADNKAYIVLNYSNEVKIADAGSLEYIATISEGLNNPRYIQVLNGKAYISCWGDAMDTTDDYVAVIDLATNDVITSISVGEGPEKMVLANDKLYVAQKGGWGYGNTVSVIDTDTNAVSSTLNVGDVPGSIVLNDGYLYVLCEGMPSWAGAGLETTGRLYKFNPENNNFLESMTIFPDVQHPANLRFNGNDIYYTKGDGVYHTTTSSELLPTEPFIPLAEQGIYGVYGFDVIDGKIYVGDALDFSSPGKVYVYAVEDGEQLADYTVGVSPNSFHKAPEPPLGLPDTIAGVNLTVYPNPATEVIFLNTAKDAFVQVYDLAGRVVIAKQQYTATGVNVSVLPTGTYLTEVTIDGTKAVKKLVIR
jgi:YVTN family beta-propeller protein